MLDPSTVITGKSVLLAALVLLVYISTLLLASRTVPGRNVSRPDLGQGRSYALNGWKIFIAVFSLAFVEAVSGHRRLAYYLVHHFWDLLIAANIFAVCLSLILYSGGRRNNPHRIADFWFGIPKDPRCWGVDLKVFSYRPSLIGWMLMNFAFAEVQMQRHGRLSMSMCLYLALTTLYLANTFRDELSLLSMYDVIAERFGFMLIWGNYVLVPFFYCLPGWFLIDHTEPLAVMTIVGVCALYCAGSWLFRGANRQKSQFKSDPSKPIWGKPPQSLDGRILVSGFWGIGRKLNYTGEILVYLAWTLTTGIESFWPYLVPTWLTLLLIHRSWRDERRCRAKYGALWDEYCRRVRFRMLPFVY